MAESHLQWIEEELESFKLKLEAAGLSKETVRVYVYYIRKLLEINCETPQKTLEVFFSKERASSSVAKAAVLNYFKLMGAKVQCVLPELRGRRRRPLKVCPKDHVRDVLKVLPREDDRLIVTLAYELALRNSEVTKLLCQNVNTQFKHINVYGKGDSKRVLPLSDDLNMVLSNYLKRYRNKFQYSDEIKKKRQDWLFPMVAQLKHPDAHFRYIMERSARYLGLDSHFNPHSLRHGKANSLYESKRVDIFVLSNFLGHVRLDTTKRYAHSSLKTMRDQIIDSDKSNSLTRSFLLKEPNEPKTDSEETNEPPISKD